MPEPAARLDPRARDVFVSRARHFGRLIGFAAASATAALSVVAAHAFKGHDGRKARTITATARTRPVRSHGTVVPPPEHVPAISGAPAPLEAPSSPPAAASSQASPPAAAAPAPAPVPVPVPAPATSGGS